MHNNQGADTDPTYQVGLECKVRNGETLVSECLIHRIGTDSQTLICAKCKEGYRSNVDGTQCDLISHATSIDIDIESPEHPVITTTISDITETIYIPTNLSSPIETSSSSSVTSSSPSVTSSSSSCDSIDKIAPSISTKPTNLPGLTDSSTTVAIEVPEDISNELNTEFEVPVGNGNTVVINNRGSRNMYLKLSGKKPKITLTTRDNNAAITGVFAQSNAETSIYIGSPNMSLNIKGRIILKSDSVDTFNIVNTTVDSEDITIESDKDILLGQLSCIENPNLLLKDYLMSILMLLKCSKVLLHHYQTVMF
ncbi:hypothetical protein TRFO_11993 [Tritrichomonas foetus]|uniref:Uncharacterized protein n=1 Tax=Tritrichomonas foetus TaxID=1144522 RepID=A0A1J4J184_9EUKA|nr:hypothetical protein TRFO_11993 [Tritrichomonas foetus]|eukprot:OHS93178.1 hypothetical protein TRFO_11993 [Tritrichomonas foetus]